MNFTPAASAVLALAGTSYGFTVSQFQIQPNQFIEPSSGSFFNAEGGFAIALGTKNLVDTSNRGTWKDFADYLGTTTWLAVDRSGGGGVYSLPLTGGPGPDPLAPEWNGNTTGELGGGTRQLRGGTDTISGIDAGPDGYIWGYDPVMPFAAPSAVTPVNGVPKDSIFFGNFGLSDTDAVLTGAPLLVTIDGVDHFLVLDGTPDPDGYRIEYERDIGALSASLRAFVVVPAPGVLGTLSLAGLHLTRRRRRRA